MTLQWYGPQVREKVVVAIKGGLNEYGLRFETSAKGRVSPGAGVLTGTYRRSIHSAHAGYNWSRDNILPSASTPERGGKGGARVARGGNVISIVIGSGMIYAMHLERLYAPILGAFREVSPQLGSIIEKHARREGLR